MQIWARDPANFHAGRAAYQALSGPDPEEPGYQVTVDTPAAPPPLWTRPAIPIPDVVFQWYIVPVNGNATLVDGSRTRTTQQLQHRYNFNPFTNSWAHFPGWSGSLPGRPAPRMRWASAVFRPSPPGVSVTPLRPRAGSGRSGGGPDPPGSRPRVPPARRCRSEGLRVFRAQYDLDGVTPIGSCVVSLDSTYAASPFYLLRITSTGLVGSPDKPRARCRILAELDLSPTVRGGSAVNPGYFRLVNWIDSGADESTCFWGPIAHSTRRLVLALTKTPTCGFKPRMGGGYSALRRLSAVLVVLFLLGALPASGQSSAKCPDCASGFIILGVCSNPSCPSNTGAPSGSSPRDNVVEMAVGANELPNYATDLRNALKQQSDWAAAVQAYPGNAAYLKNYQTATWWVQQAQDRANKQAVMRVYMTGHPSLPPAPSREQFRQWLATGQNWLKLGEVIEFRGP